MAIIYIKSYIENRELLQVKLESLIVLNVLKVCNIKDINLKVVIETNENLKEPLFTVHLSEVSATFILTEEINKIANFCIWPVVIVTNTVISGLAAVCRQILKMSSDSETLALLGFREACLMACSEVSIWTKFCEVDIISTIKKLLAHEDFSYVPKDFSRFESHLDQPVRIHNVYKLARVKNNDKLIRSDVPVDQLNLEHQFAEGPYMTLADLLLYPCYFIFFKIFDENAAAEMLPLSVSWFQSLKSHKFGSLLNFSLPQNVTRFQGSLTLEQEVNGKSLYKGAATVSKNQNRAYTKQENIEKALSKVTLFSISLSEAFVKNLNFSWSDVPLDANPLGGAVPKSRAARKLSQLESLAKVVVEIAKTDSLTIVDFCSGGGHLGILVATLLRNCRVILVENKERSLQEARERINNLKLSNISLVQSNLDYFIGSFDIGMSLHACGVATDLVIQSCVFNKAHFVCCPCCYGFISDCERVTYPKSKVFKNSSLSYNNYLTICHAADQTHDKENVKTEQGYQCMNVIDSDRKFRAEEDGYEVFLNKLYPLSCTPKNNVLIGIYCKK